MSFKQSSYCWRNNTHTIPQWDMCYKLQYQRPLFHDVDIEVCLTWIDILIIVLLIELFEDLK